MTITIGLRFYRISITESRSTRLLNLAKFNLMAFLETFLSAHAKPKDDDELQRSWRIEPYDSAGTGEFWGIIKYATFGYESEIVDWKSRAPKYRRQSNDLEEIPLFYHFWVPQDDEFAIVAFQSFQGRSCIQLVTSSAAEAFKKKYQNMSLRFEKVSPNYFSATSLYRSPVKKLTLIKKKPINDRASALLNGIGVDNYNYEVSFVAKRNSNFGSLAEFLGGLGDNPDSVLLHGAEGYDKAVAEVAWNGRRRRVGVAGPDMDTGAIDITDEVVLSNGHPTFQSVSKESSNLMDEIYEKMTRKA